MAGGDPKRYRDDLVDAQIKLSERLRHADTPAQLTSLAEDLAKTLRGVAENERLWEGLAADAGGGLDEQQLFQLTLVDWEQILLDRGVEEGEAGELADELISAARHASEGQANWDEVKQGLVALANLLEDDAGEVRRQGLGGRLTSLRERVAGGVAALRHVKTAVLWKGVGEGLSMAAVPPVAAAVVAGVVFPPGFLAMTIVAGVVGLGWATGEALNRGLGEVAAREVIDRFRRLDWEISGIQGTIPDRQTELDELVRLASKSDKNALDEIMQLFSGLRRWAADVGAKIAAEWPFVVAHFGKAGALRLEEATREIADFRRSLKGLSEAIYGGLADVVQRTAETAGVALRAVDDRLERLRNSLIGGAFEA